MRVLRRGRRGSRADRETRPVFCPCRRSTSYSMLPFPNRHPLRNRRRAVTVDALLEPFEQPHARIVTRQNALRLPAARTSSVDELRHAADRVPCDSDCSDQVVAVAIDDERRDRDRLRRAQADTPWRRCSAARESGWRARTRARQNARSIGTSRCVRIRSVICDRSL